jgi:MFS family permease
MPADQNQKSIWAVFGALFLALWLAAIDQTVVSTALPTMVAELGGLSYLSWVVTAYLLTSTVAGPLYGKFGDLYGCRWRSSCSSPARRCAASRRTCCSSSCSARWKASAAAD